MSARVLCLVLITWVASPCAWGQKPVVSTDATGSIYLEEVVSKPGRSASEIINDARAWLLRDVVRREVLRASESSITVEGEAGVLTQVAYDQQVPVSLRYELTLAGSDKTLTLRMTNLSITQPEASGDILGSTTYVRYSLDELMAAFERENSQAQADIRLFYQRFQEIFGDFVEAVPGGALASFGFGPTNWPAPADVVPEAPEPVLAAGKRARFEQVFACAGSGDQGLRERLEVWAGRWNDLELESAIMTDDLRLARGNYKRKNPSDEYHYFVAVELRDDTCRVSLIDMDRESGRHTGHYEPFAELHEKSTSRSRRKQQQGEIPVQIFTTIARRTFESFVDTVLDG